MLLLFLIRNFMPRRGDLAGVRSWEVPVLSALMTGENFISLRYIIMMNILEAHQAMDKQYIPHVRLITRLLKNHDVDVRGYNGMSKELGPLLITRLKKMYLSFSMSGRYAKLENDYTGEWWRVVKDGERELEDGEEETEVVGFGITPRIPVGRAEREGPSAMHIDPQVPGSFRGFVAGYAYTNDGDYSTPSSFVVQNRPQDFGSWSPFEQASYDRSTQVLEQSRHSFERQEMWNRVHAFNDQMEINLRYHDDQQRRMREEWLSGEQVVQRPPYVDYSSMPEPYDGVTVYPDHAAHHSAWLDPYQYPPQSYTDPQQQQQPPDQGSSSGGATGSAFDMGGIMDVMRGIFGNPQDPYYR